VDPSEKDGAESPTSWRLPLTRREAEVTRYVADGYSNGAIAKKLEISTSTVSAHIASAKVKLRARSRAQLASIFTLACAHRASAMFLQVLTLGPQDSN
jgi:DNA-binding CsgD family transcriptional regulator